MICLDTNIVVALLNGRRPEARKRYDAARRADEALALSVVTLFELRFGVPNSARPDANHRALDAFIEDTVDVLDFDAEDARDAGAIRAHLRAKGTPIGPYDILIGAQARRRGAALITANGSEFARVPGLAIDDWTE